jgi:hypothetical protein
VAYEDHRAFRALCHRGELVKHAAHVLVAMAVNFAGQIRHEHVDDDETDIFFADELLYDVDIAWQRRRDLTLVPVVVEHGDIGECVDLGSVGASRCESRSDCVGKPIFGRQQEDVSGMRTSRAVRPAPTSADDGCDVERQRGFASAGVAVDHDELAEWESSRPEPTHPFGFNVSEGPDCALIDGRLFWLLAGRFFQRGMVREFVENDCGLASRVRGWQGTPFLAIPCRYR